MIIELMKAMITLIAAIIRVVIILVRMMRSVGVSHDPSSRLDHHGNHGNLTNEKDSGQRLQGGSQVSDMK